MPKPRERLIVALDVPSVAEAESLIGRLGDAVTFYKKRIMTPSADPKAAAEAIVAEIAAASA